MTLTGNQPPTQQQILYAVSRTNTGGNLTNNDLAQLNAASKASQLAYTSKGGTNKRKSNKQRSNKKRSNKKRSNKKGQIKRDK